MKAKKALRRGGPKTFTTNFPFHFDASQQRQVKTCEQICRIAKMTFSILLKLLLVKIMLRDPLIGLSFRLDLRLEDIFFVSNLHFQYFHRIEVKRLYEIFSHEKGQLLGTAGALFNPSPTKVCIINFSIVSQQCNSIIFCEFIPSFFCEKFLFDKVINDFLVQNFYVFPRQ